MYHNNNPIKPIINIGVILYKFINNKLHILLCKIDDKYDLIYYTNNSIANSASVCDRVIERIYNATNYLILLDINDIKKNTTFESYDELSLTIIKFIQIPNNYLYLESFYFNCYEIITDDEKIKRELKWIEFEYFNNRIIFNNKVQTRLKNKDVTKILHSIYKNHNLYLNKIKFQN